ncbi:aspartate-semialdehyde dehydrogenase [Clostridium kluyveri]|uniref:aspartate-semialdehyde dehydrogenase n=1 Tax=Clostridium kluyveri TaxID=1534 RepID=UPI002247CC3C|nr:aspartate-semialdehyde dehydrogenase [Clostridium kluyveri]UZQ49297.1 aspartate-semialdehyde dehydrogenase [Clostridium kluyveri]
MSCNLAVVGCTGMVGMKFLEVLEERDFPVKNLYLYASAKSDGKVLKFSGKDYVVEELKEDNIKNKKIDIALFSAGGSTSLEFAPVFSKYGAVVVDNSSAWRMDKDIPLVVPEVNPEDIKWNKGIIANPNCSTIQALVPIKPLYDKYGIKRIIYSTYQAVSGAGVGGYNDLMEGYKGNPPKKFPFPIAGNVIPHIDTFLENGYTKEEMKMIDETKKILHDDTLKITATTVRVPVVYGHSESINIELKKDFELEDIFNLYKECNGIVLKDDVQNGKYPMPIDAAGNNEVYVGRIRRDFSLDSGLNLWVVADNIRKGAATNAVQIAECLIK